jgi:hypothetical protein
MYSSICKKPAIACPGIRWIHESFVIIGIFTDMTIGVHMIEWLKLVQMFDQAIVVMMLQSHNPMRLMQFTTKIL